MNNNNNGAKVRSLKPIMIGIPPCTPITPCFPSLVNFHLPISYILSLFLIFTCISLKRKSQAVKLLSFLISSTRSFSTGWGYYLRYLVDILRRETHQGAVTPEELIGIPHI